MPEKRSLDAWIFVGVPIAMFAGLLIVDPTSSDLPWIDRAAIGLAFAAIWGPLAWFRSRR